MEGKFVITGGGGMLAQALARELKRRGRPAVAVDRANCDIADERSVQRLFESHRPAVLLNAAAYTRVDAAESNRDAADAINGYAAGRLARFARLHGTFLVHFSTDFVFDGHASQPYKPGDPTAPLGAYGASKLLGETLVQADAPPQCLIVRTAWLFGHPGACFPRTMLQRGSAGQPLRVVDDQIGSPTYTDDLAAITLDLVDRQKSGLFHVANAGITSWFDFAIAVLEEFGIKTSITPIRTADWSAARPNDARRPSYSVLDSSAAESAVGRSMRLWREALRDYRITQDSKRSG